MLEIHSGDTIVKDFANRDILDFLAGIAHNLQFVQ